MKSNKTSLRFSDLLYRQTLTINNSALEVEIVDVSSCDLSLFPEEAVYWADACVVVYDITNRTSFMQASELLQKVQQLRSQISVVLLGNKSDLEHLRQVTILFLIERRPLVDNVHRKLDWNLKFPHQTLKCFGNLFYGAVTSIIAATVVEKKGSKDRRTSRANCPYGHTQI